MVAEHCSVHGALRVMALLLLLVMPGNSMMVDLCANVERYSKVALEAVYSEAKVKFEAEMKPGYRSWDYAMVDHYVMDELNSDNVVDP